MRKLLLLLLPLILWACKDDAVKLHHVYIVGDKYTIAPGDSIQLHILAYPENATLGFPTNTTIVWSSADTTIASVTQSGMLVAHKFGVVNISIVFGQLTADRDFTISTISEVTDENLLSFLLDRFDTNGDGVLEGYETASTTGLDLTDVRKLTLDYVDMQGLGDFVNVQTLRIERLNMKNLDLSGLSNLSELYIEACNIDTIDLRANASLTDVRVFACTSLKALIFGDYATYGANGLRTLHCSRNDLSELDLTRCGATLWDIDCSENDRLTNLDISADTILHTLKYSCNTTNVVMPATDPDYIILECVE